MFENVRNDFRAHNRDWSAQGFWVMLTYRFGRWRYQIRPAVIRKPFSLICRFLFKVIQIVTGIELPCEAEVGDNFVIDHFGGIIVSGYAKFGDNCPIHNDVTVGLRRAEEQFAPAVGKDVILGANAAVLSDVPSSSIAVGIPAVIKPRSSRCN